MLMFGSLLSQALRLGPAPYFAAAAVILTIGAAWQMMSGSAGPGPTVFGQVARIGGVAALMGLLPLILTDAGLIRPKNEVVPMPDVPPNRQPRPTPGSPPPAAKPALVVSPQMRRMAIRLVQMLGKTALRGLIRRG